MLVSLSTINLGTIATKSILLGKLYAWDSLADLDERQRINGVWRKKTRLPKCELRNGMYDVKLELQAAPLFSQNCCFIEDWKDWNMTWDGLKWMRFSRTWSSHIHILFCSIDGECEYENLYGPLFWQHEVLVRIIPVNCAKENMNMKTVKCKRDIYIHFNPLNSSQVIFQSFKDHFLHYKLRPNFPKKQKLSLKRTRSQA